MRSAVDRGLGLLEPCAGRALSDPRPVVGRGAPASATCRLSPDGHFQTKRSSEIDSSLLRQFQTII